MRWIVLSVLLAVLLVSCWACAPIERRYSITVAGQAAVMAVPDRAVITLTIETGRIHSQRSHAKRDLDHLATILMEYLHDVGVPEQKIKSAFRRVGPVYRHTDGKRILQGYVGTQRFLITVPDEQDDDILDDLPDVANEDGVAFMVSNERELRDGIVDDAIADAKARAGRRAEKLGIQLGPVIGFNESFLGQAKAQPQGMRVGMSMDEAAPQLPPGENELRVNVSITYMINVPD